MVAHPNGGCTPATPLDAPSAAVGETDGKTPATSFVSPKSPSNNSTITAARLALTLCSLLTQTLSFMRTLRSLTHSHYMLRRQMEETGAHAPILISILSSKYMLPGLMSLQKSNFYSRSQKGSLTCVSFRTDECAALLHSTDGTSARSAQGSSINLSQRREPQYNQSLAIGAIYVAPQSPSEGYLSIHLSIYLPDGCQQSPHAACGSQSSTPC